MVASDGEKLNSISIGDKVYWRDEAGQPQYARVYGFKIGLDTGRHKVIVRRAGQELAIPLARIFKRYRDQGIEPGDLFFESTLLSL